MYATSLTFALLLILSWLTLGNYDRSMAHNSASQIQITAGQMRAYGSFVSAYARTNPTASGAVADNVVGIPSWMVRDALITNRVSGGTALIAYQSASKFEALALARTCPVGMTCGMASQSRLLVPGQSTLSNIDTTGILEGSAVFVFN